MPDLWVGRTLSKVHIQQLIARGGMADVYLGQHVTLNIPRAVKILHGNLTEDPELRRRFNEEAKAVAALRHPNIVQVYDLDLHEGTPYIVMELLQGPSMAGYLRELHNLGHTLPFESVALILDGLAAALDFAHAEGIVHRDIKPANVILREGSIPIRPSLPLPLDVTPILTDFGIARISSSTTQTLAGMILGTPAYMSPEQVRGETADARADIYSLGIMLYELLAGTLPFDPDVDTTASVLYKQANVPPPPLPNVDVDVRAVVDRALEKKPEDRHQTAGDLAAAFRQAARLGATTIVHPTPASVAAGDRARRRVRPLWVALAVAAIVVVGAAAGILGTRRTRPDAPSPVAPSPTTSSAELLPPVTATVSVAAPAVEVVGGAVLQDASAQIVVEDATAPKVNQDYSVWFASPDGPAVGFPADFANGAVRAAFVDPERSNLLAVYTGISISLEPSPDPARDVPGTIVFVGEFPASIASEARRLDGLSRGLPTTQAILEGLETQSATHDSHLQFALDALIDGDLPAAKAHAEHAINILVGQDSPEFGDWDGNGLPENPGDGFGLMAYAALATSLLTSDLENPSTSPGSAQDIETLLDDFRGLMDQAEASIRLAQRIAAADTVPEARSTADTWASIRFAESAADLASRSEDVGLRLWIPVRAAP